ncbi:MAG: hypothetical protein KGL39_37370 [Patescibacteria group bacterium]|nr:hypothetical protein [Patescibacteria group bacterium]
MAYQQKISRGGEVLETAEVAAERALATAKHSAAIKGDVQRVNYNGTTVEVPTIDHQALGRPVDKQYERNRASVENRLKAIGVLTATVINFLPIPLVSDSTLFPLKPTRCKVPGPKDHEKYGIFVFDQAWIEHTRQGIDSPMIAWEYHPIELASEFSRLHPRGVMTFIGIPSDLDDPAWLKKKSPEDQHQGRTYGQVLQDAEQGAIEVMQDWLRAGNEDALIKRIVSAKSKFAARRLKALGMIANIPDWVEKQRDVHQKIPVCPNCQKPCEPGAAQCTNTNCNYIIDPQKAYEIGAIAEDHAALERLTREEVKAMGISDYVAETRDEKPARQKLGIPKPLSAAAQRLQESQEAEENDRRKAKSKSQE